MLFKSKKPKEKKRAEISKGNIIVHVFPSDLDSILDLPGFKLKSQYQTLFGVDELEWGHIVFDECILVFKVIKEQEDAV